jgi:hypothetical protein
VAVTPSQTHMDTFAHAVDDVLMIVTIVIGVGCIGIFAAALMASAGAYWLIKRLKRRKANDASEQKDQLRNVFKCRVIEFYVPDNLRENRQGEIWSYNRRSGRPAAR